MGMGRPKEHNRHLPPRMRFLHGAYHHEFYEAGRKRSKRLSADYSEAIRLYYDREGAQPAGSTVGHALNRYEAEVLPTKAGATQREYRRYIQRLREVFGDCGLESVKRRDVAMYLDRRTAKVEGNREIACLSSVYRSAIRWGWCDDNPCAGAPRNTEPKARRIPTEAEIAAIRLAANEQFRCIVDLARLIGLSRSDLIKIRLSDVTERGLRVVRQKTKTARLYVWTPTLREIIGRARALRRRAGSVYLFARRDGQPYTPNGFDAILAGICRKAGVKGVMTHAIRRFAITRSSEAKGLDHAQAIGGHKSRQATEIYVIRPEVEVEPIE